MSPAEIGHRLAGWWTLRSLRREYRLGAQCEASLVPESFRFCSSPIPQLPELSWTSTLEPYKPGCVVSSHWASSGFVWPEISDMSTWHRAPDTRRSWPCEFFGDISYRTDNAFGDARVVWEPARLQQLVSLALQGKQMAPESRCAIEVLESTLHSWVKANPTLMGIHYVSAMECALRIVSVSHAVDMVRHRLTQAGETWTSVVQLVGSHAPLIAQRLSLYSSSGNHTIAEGTGLVYAGALFQELPAAAKWKALGLAILQKEASRQVLPDGGGIEQAVWYQLFITDLLGLVESLLKYRNEIVPAAISDAVERGRLFLSTFGESPEDLPQIGDSDNGYALSEHLRTSWISVAEDCSLVTTFPDAGYTILRCGAPRPVRMVLDHGSLGMSPAYGHGHADALSVHLRIGKQEFLIDPGTYTYTGDQRWRRLFRGTAAHNTVTVDHLDQSVQETAFMWSHPYRAELVHKEETPEGKVILLGRHDGYEKRVGVTHWRAVIFEPPGCWLIWDRLVGSGDHRLELNWHLGVEPRLESGRYLLQMDECRLALAVEGMGPPYPAATIRNGWRSRHYGSKEPISTLQTLYTGMLPYEFSTRLWIDVDARRHESAFQSLAFLRSLTGDIEPR